jgi:hypothetical protein
MDPSSKTTTTTVAKKRKKFSNLSPDKNSTAIFATHLVAMSQRQNASASQDWSRNGLEAVNNSLEEIGPSLAEILRPESLLHIFSPSFNFPTNLSKHEKDSEGNQGES